MPVTFLHPTRLPFVEARQANNSMACYRPHTHPTLSIGIVDAGCSILSFADRLVRLRAGDVVIINAGVVHACNPQPGRRWSYRMLYLDTQWAGVPVPPPAWEVPLRGADDREVVNAMMEIVRAGQADAADVGQLRVLVASLLGRAARATASAVAAAPAWLEPARRHIAEHCAEALPLQTLARRSGVSPFVFLRHFKRHHGLTPHAYQLDQRITRARQLLKEGLPAAHVAHDLGFSDQSHLLRVFKTRVAATPRQFRGTDAHVR